MRKSGRFAWVEFASLAVSQQALALDGESLGSGVMKVSQSKTPIHTAGWRAAVSPCSSAAAAAAAGRADKHSASLTSAQSTSHELGQVARAA